MSFPAQQLRARVGNEGAWRKWYDENEPESVPIPDYDERINMDRTEFFRHRKSSGEGAINSERTWGMNMNLFPRNIPYSTGSRWELLRVSQPSNRH